MCGCMHGTLSVSAEAFLPFHARNPASATVLGMETERR